MAEVQKGTVTEVTSNTSAVVRPFGAGSALTPPLPVQRALYSEISPALAVGDSVAFALFEDGTGLIIDKI